MRTRRKRSEIARDCTKIEQAAESIVKPTSVQDDELASATSRLDCKLSPVSENNSSKPRSCISCGMYCSVRFGLRYFGARVFKPEA